MLAFLPSLPPHVGSAIKLSGQGWLFWGLVCVFLLSPTHNRTPPPRQTAHISAPFSPRSFLHAGLILVSSTRFRPPLSSGVLEDEVIFWRVAVLLFCAAAGSRGPRSQVGSCDRDSATTGAAAHPQTVSVIVGSIHSLSSESAEAASGQIDGFSWHR